MIAKRLGAFVNFGARILSSGCAPKDLDERKAEWELDVEPPAVRENSSHLCARSGADHVPINVFHLAAARGLVASTANVFFSVEGSLAGPSVGEPAKETVSPESACRPTPANSGPSSRL